MHTDYDSKTGACLSRLEIIGQSLVQSLVGDPNSKENSKNGKFRWHYTIKYALYVVDELVFSVPIGQEPKNPCICTQISNT